MRIIQKRWSFTSKLISHFNEKSFPFAITFLKWFDYRSTLIHFVLTSIHKTTQRATKRKLSITFNINHTWTALFIYYQPILLHVKLIYNLIRLSLYRRYPAYARREIFLLQNNLIIPQSKRVALTFTLNYIFPAPTPLRRTTSLYWAMFLIFLLFQTGPAVIDRSVAGKVRTGGTTEVQVFLIYKIGKFSAAEGLERRASVF